MIPVFRILYTNTIKTINMVRKNLTDMPQQMICPCGGGQSCIVDRRWVGDWVHEDNVLVSKGVPVRTNCFSALSKEQEKAMDDFMKKI